MVLNALDNLGNFQGRLEKKQTSTKNTFFFVEARRHVNAMCLAADVPLVESGTQGYFGQAYVIKKVEYICKYIRKVSSVEI